MFSETFFTSLYIASFGFFGIVLGVIYKSKCSHAKCCCFEIDRDTIAEERIDELSIKTPTMLNNSLNTIGTQV